MLVLTRRTNESIRIGDDILVTVVQIGPGKVRIGIDAPPGCMILREELVDRSAEARPIGPIALTPAPVAPGESVDLSARS